MDPLLKQRMVGTAVIIGLAVIFVPMVLDGPVEDRAVRQSTGVPLALPEPLDQTSATSPEPAPEPSPEPRREPPAQPARTAASGWVVQLGSFGAEGNANALAQRVSDAGFDAFVQRVEVENGTMYRVRVGPVADRDAAAALAQRVGRETGEPTVVAEHP